MNLKNEASAINDALVKMTGEITAITAQRHRDYPEPLAVHDRITYEIRATNTTLNVIAEALAQTMLGLRDLMAELGGVGESAGTNSE